MPLCLCGKINSHFVFCKKVQLTIKTSSKKVIVIGAGIAGIASAIRMAARGYKVDVFESNPYPGGKLTEIQSGDYRFDAGPSLFTMPEYINALFECAGEQMSDHFRYEKLEVICNYFWEDGTALSAFADTEQFKKEVTDKLEVSGNRIDAALKESQRKYDLTGKIFLEKSLHKKETWLKTDVAKAMLQTPSMGIFKSMHAVNQKILGNKKLVQLFDRYATYNGSNPYKASGMLTIIPHFEYGIGAFFPKGGMHQITMSLFELAKRKGVTFHFNKLVTEIIHEKGNVVGVKVNKESIKADRVISNMDIYPTYKKLLPTVKAPMKILNQEKSSSALIFYWGIQQQFPTLELHNILFSENYKEEFDHIAKGKIATDPTVYINITSKHNPTDAPIGCENWFTMINVPYNDGQDWDALIATARKNIIQKINRILKLDIESLITCESILDPRTIESKTGSNSGALYGYSSNSMMAAFFRHKNFSTKIKGLYFCGGSVHPGGGIPLCLLSAKIVDDVMHE